MYKLIFIGLFNLEKTNEKMSAHLDNEMDWGRLDRDNFIHDYEKTKRYQPSSKQSMWYQPKPEQTTINPKDEESVVWTCP